MNNIFVNGNVKKYIYYNIMKSDVGKNTSVFFFICVLCAIFILLETIKVTKDKNIFLRIMILLTAGIFSLGLIFSSFVL